jgi:hypothetical protein
MSDKYRLNAPTFYAKSLPRGIAESVHFLKAIDRHDPGKALFT